MLMAQGVRAKLKEREWIYWRRGRVLENQRRHREQEFVAPQPRAGFRQCVEVGIVNQMDAHHHQRTDVNRESELGPVWARRNIADRIATDDRHAAFVNPGEARRVESGQSFAPGVPGALDLAPLMAAGAER